jgi:hypothetical protein
MTTYAVATIDNKGRPAWFHFQNEQKTVAFEIFRQGGGKNLAETFKRFDGAHELLSWAAQGDFRSPNMGDLLRAFNMEELHGGTQARDYAYSSIKSTGDSSKDKILCEKIVELVKAVPNRPYQNILAKAQSVYVGMERTGLMLNYTKMEPHWSWDTYSGRSKCTGFNVQGWSNADAIYQPMMPYESVQLHFDWICADFRIASLFSGDDALNSSFFDSDPYTYLSKRLTGCGSQARDDAKLLLLKTINSLDYSDEVIRGEFPKLCNWLQGTLMKLREDKYSANIVGRQFRLKQDRTERSVFNAILQGSVAAAMQNVLWNVRRMFPNYLITDIHDGVVLSLPKDKKILGHVVEKVGEIFYRPFDGIFTQDLVFPYKVSMGNRWKQWKEISVVRSKQI